eukprot:TRINITY_DN28127_c0_g1_i2.p3 TRINITY_DN28127_c0_g1~~TRINITY_DN28127_c0_g1_i2.p3  ORF type:complete len:107 (+),score=21.30 TRINITY_DN28127_c0_g1_i2:1498-1818(+)
MAESTSSLFSTLMRSRCQMSTMRYRLTIHGTLRAPPSYMLNCASFTILSALPVQQSVYAVRVEIVANDENGGDAKKYFWILGNCGTGWRTESVMPDTSFDIEDDED